MDILFQSASAANIFVIGEPASFSLSHDQASPVTIDIVLQDELGNTLATRTRNVPAGQAVTVNFHPRPGYYEATAQGTGANAQAAVTVILAVIDPLPASVASAASPFGVMTHFQQNMNTDVIPLLVLAGIRHVRDEQIWQAIEPNGGGTRDYSAFVPYMAALATAGIDPLLIGDFANPNYDGGNTPYTAAGVAGYTSYAADLAQRWQAQVGTLEIWNEYNGTCCQGTATANRPQYYTAMLAAAYRAIKAKSPATAVLGGATALVPVPYFQQMFADGLYGMLDGYCVHPYYSPAEAVPRYFANFRAVEAGYRGPGEAKPIWATECGLDQGDDGSNARRELGIYLVKFLTTLLSAGVARAYWYLARDFGPATTGLLHDQFFTGGGYAPTVAFVAFAALNKYLSGSTYLGRDGTSDRRTYSHHFQLADGSDFRVVYSTRAGPSVLAVRWAAQPPGGSGAAVAPALTILNYMGGTIDRGNPAATAPRRRLTLTDEPVYLRGPVTSITEQYTDRLLAESVLDFSSTAQGVNGWSYGWRTDSDATFHPGTASNDAYDYFWTGPYYYLQIAAGSALGSAGQDARGNHYQVWATRRYVPGETVSARVAGSVGRGSVGEGDGAGLNILLNGETIFSRSLGTAADTCTANFDLTVTLVAGQPLDFCITPGPAYDNSYDACSFDVQIIALA